MNMKLIGAPTIKDVVPGMVDTRSLNPGNAPDTMFEANCKSISLRSLLSLRGVE